MSQQDTATIEEFIRQATQYMQIPCDITVSREITGAMTVALQTNEDGRLLIGKNGQNLKALEHIVRLVSIRQNPEHHPVLIDVNNYRAEQKQQLVEMIRATAERVQQTQRSEALEPMTSYQRRVVHTELAAYSGLATESVGQDPHRRVVIKPL